MERLSLDFERHADGVVLRLAGHLEEGTAPLLAGTLTALLAERSDVTLDLERVRSLDGAGVALLLTAGAAAREAGVELEVTGIQASLHRHGEGPDTTGETMRDG